jgi:hypothetical protein
MGADGVLVPYINTAEEARQAVSCMRYPTAGTRSVYFPQRSMNSAGLLGYAGAVLGAGIVGVYGIVRYQQILVQAERIGEHATCPGCAAYGRFQLVADCMARCRKCDREWQLIE